MAVVATVEEIKAAQQKLAEQAKEAEAARRAADKVVSITSGQSGVYAVTLEGRIFFRSIDTRVSNDGRGGDRYRWAEVEGPLA